jgi:hypothetical protein
VGSIAFLALSARLIAGCSSDARFAQIDEHLSKLETQLAALSASRQASPPTQPAPQTKRPAPIPSAFTGWFLSGGGMKVYDVASDPDIKHVDHPTMQLSPTAPTLGNYGTYMTSVGAEKYAGKRVRVSAWTRTEGTSERADFWARVRAHDSRDDGPGLGGDDQPLGAGSDWTKHEIVMDVPERGDSIQFGVGIAGPGRLWVDDPKLEVVGSDVAVTGTTPPESKVKGWFLHGDNPDSYEIDVDAATKHSGKASGSIHSVKVSTGFGTLMQRVPSAAYLGKRLRLSAFIKAEGVDNWAGLWMRLDTEANNGISFDNMEDRPIKGTVDWKKYEVVLDVPISATNLSFGVLLAGPGRVWIDDVKLEPVGKEVPTTGKQSIGPLNLEFEQ